MYPHVPCLRCHTSDTESDSDPAVPSAKQAGSRAGANRGRTQLPTNVESHPFFVCIGGVAGRDVHAAAALTCMYDGAVDLLHMVPRWLLEAATAQLMRLRNEVYEDSGRYGDAEDEDAARDRTATTTSAGLPAFEIAAQRVRLCRGLLTFLRTVCSSNGGMTRTQVHADGTVMAIHV